MNAVWGTVLGILSVTQNRAMLEDTLSTIVFLAWRSIVLINVLVQMRMGTSINVPLSVCFTSFVNKRQRRSDDVILDLPPPSSHAKSGMLNPCSLPKPFSTSFNASLPRSFIPSEGTI